MSIEYFDSHLDKVSDARRQLPQLKYFGEEPLHSPAQEVELAEGLRIADELSDTLKKYREITGLGRGLAAPQINYAKRVFVTFIDDHIQTYINPSIVDKSESMNKYRELCISSGYVWGDIERPVSITLKWLDESGKERTEVFESFAARLIQHEVDHLDGVVCLDKVTPGTFSLVSSDPQDEKLRD